MADDKELKVKINLQKPNCWRALARQRTILGFMNSGQCRGVSYVISSGLLVLGWKSVCALKSQFSLLIISLHPIDPF